MRWPKYWSFSFSIIPSKDKYLKFRRHGQAAIFLSYGRSHFGALILRCIYPLYFVELKITQEFSKA